jgi:hypothetical protein
MVGAQPSGRTRLGEPVNVDKAFKLFKEAKVRCKHADFVVIGSNSVIAYATSGENIPDDMTRSIDFDAYPLNDPGRVSDLMKDLGEDSPFHRSEGIYLDAVSPTTATLPEGWRDRLVKAERDGVRLWCLEPNDAAVSKYVRSEPRDLRWIRAGIAASLISLPTVRLRLKQTFFSDDAEEKRAWASFEADARNKK